MIRTQPPSRHVPLRVRTPLRRTPFRRKPRSRKTKTRTILYGIKYMALRRDKAYNASECCEHCGIFAPLYHENELCMGQLAHKGRGANRDSTVEGTMWLCRSCHDTLDNRNQKVCPVKPGKESK